MAAKKRKTGTRRRRRVHHLSALPARRKGRRRRRRAMGEGATAVRYVRRNASKTFTRTGIIEEGKRFIFGTLGGLSAGVGHQLMASVPTWGRISIQGAISILICGVGGAKSIGAGYAGGASALEAQGFTQKTLSEAGFGANKYADNKAANQLPLSLSANGSTLTLMEDTSTNKFYYLDENTGNAYLAESIYPEYSPRYNQ